MESSLSCQTSSVFETIASKNPSLIEDVEMTKFQFLGLEQYFSNRCLAITLSSIMSIVNMNIMTHDNMRVAYENV
jgi:hypothetical protein